MPQWDMLWANDIKLLILSHKHFEVVRENENVETDPTNVSELSNNYFSRIPTDIGFDDRITSASDAAFAKPECRENMTNIWQRIYSLL